MIINRKRMDRFIAEKGYRRNLAPDDWRKLISIVLDECGEGLCYSFCLVTQQRPPPKEAYLGFPGRVMAVLDYLYIVDLFIVDDAPRQRVESHLDEIPCPWEHLVQYDSDSHSDEVIGIRIVGFDKEKKT